VEELANIQGFDQDIASELQSRAVDYVEQEAKRINTALDDMKVSDDLRNFEYISLSMLLTLAEANVRSLDDLADLDNDELVEILAEHELTDDSEAGDIIMAARAHWFADEDNAENDAAASDEASADSAAEDGGDAADS
jgi:N utilization substance protein A